MLEIFKKKEEKKEVPQFHPNAPGQVFETGKEVQYKDPKTGEFVYQKALSPDQRKVVMAAMQKNAELANKFITISRQFITSQEAMIQTNKDILVSENEINDAVSAVRDEMKLDKRWGLNFALGVLERRDAPNG